MLSAGNVRDGQLIAKTPWVASRSYRASATFPDWSVLYNLRTGQLLLLEGSSSLVWQALQFGRAVGASVAPVAAALKADAEQVAPELFGFVELLERKGILASDTLPAGSRTIVAPAPKSDETALETAIEQRMVAERTLWRLFIEVTYRCNEDCIHCFNPTERRTKELSTEEIAGVLRDARELGALLLCMTGGEAFTRRDMFELLAEARRHEYAVDLYTNGVLLDDAKRERLAALYPRSVSVSIYSADPAIHDATTQIRGSHARSLETLRHLRQLGVPTNIKCPLMRHTAPGYRGVKELADELGATVQFDLVLAPKNDGNLDPVQHRVTDPAMLRTLLMDEDIPLFVGKERIEREAKKANRNGNFCGAGLANLDIGPEGTVTPCVSLPLPVGNVREASLGAIWSAVRSPLHRWRDIRVDDYAGCSSCGRQAHCTKCAGLALVEHGDFLGPSDQDCMISIARVKLAEEKGLVAPGSISLVPGRERLGVNRPNETVRRGFSSPLLKLTQLRVKSAT